MTKDPYQRRVKHLMSKVVLTVGADDSMHEAIELMRDHKISAVPVVDQKERCVGFLSATDLLELTREIEASLEDLDLVSEISRQWLLERLAENDLGRQTVSELMSRSVASTDPEAPLTDAAAEMLRHRVHHLPVLDEGQRILGIISTSDLLTAFIEGAED